jgi:hypothetical protein
LRRLQVPHLATIDPSPAYRCFAGNGIRYRAMLPANCSTTMSGNRAVYDLNPLEGKSCNDPALFDHEAAGPFTGTYRP